MAYDSRYGRHEAEPTVAAGVTGHRYPGQAGFHEEPAYQGSGYETGYDVGAGPAGEQSALPGLLGAQTTAARSEAPGEAEFGEQAEPVADRLAVHLVWEFVLLLTVGALLYLLLQGQPDALRGASLAALLVAAGGFGLLGLAAGVTLRAGAPNLAIGPVAVAAGAYYAERGGDGVLVPTIFATGMAIVLGLAVALVIVVFHVPGWAASLAAAGAVVVWLQLQPAEIPLAGGFDPSNHAAFLFAAVAALAVLGGLLGTSRSVRYALGGFRPAGDPATRRGGQAALFTTGATVLSMIFAVAAGVVLVASAGGSAQGSVGVNWLTWTLLGLGVALVGGTSAFGRRGGVFGTLLAVVALLLFHQYQQHQGWQISLLATAAAMVVLGLAVTRLVERFGRPVTGEDDIAEWTTTSVGSRTTTTPIERDSWPVPPERTASPADTWSTGLPTRAAPAQPPPWEDERWSR